MTLGIEYFDHHVNEFIVFRTLNTNYKYTVNYTFGVTTVSIITETKKPLKGYKKEQLPSY